VSATDRRVVAILAWVLGLLVFFLAIARAADLRYLDSDRWPSDLYAFTHLDSGPLDVAVLGSSRSAFGLSPSAIEGCLEREARRAQGADYTVVNLARYFSSIVGQSVVARDVLVGERTPRMVLAEVSPGLVNDYYNMLYIDVGENGRIGDIPACLAATRDGRTAVSCARPLLRGVENVSWAVASRFDELRQPTWMMTYKGGGQFCFGGAVCKDHNREYVDGMSRYWKRRVKNMVPIIKTERFSRFQVGEGIAHDYLGKLIDWSDENGVELVLVNMPVHKVYQQEIPPEDYRAFLSYMQRLVAERGVRFYDANDDHWQQARPLYFDPDHLNDKGAAQLSRQICREVAAPALARQQ